MTAVSLITALSHKLRSILMPMTFARNFPRNGQTPTQLELQPSATHDFDSIADLVPEIQEDRPIVFVAHSLGGLVAAQALVHGDQRSENSAAQRIARNLRGMIFLGTPFKGSSAAKLAEIARRILELFGVDTQQHTLRLLGVDSERLDELTRSFASVVGKRRSSKEPSDMLQAFFFYETLKTGFRKAAIQVLSVLATIHNSGVQQC